MNRLLLFCLFTLMCCLAAPSQTSNKRRAAQQKRTTATTQKKKQQQKSTARPQQKKSTAKQQKSTTAKQQKPTTAKQQKPTVQSLQKEQKALQQKRAANQRKQEELKRGVKKGMETLMIIDQEIADKRRTIDTIQSNINRLSDHIALLDREYAGLCMQLEERRQRYMKSLRYQHRNRNVQNQMMFVFSADNFNQMYRRMRFAREYAAYQKAQGEAVKAKQLEVTKKKQELNESRKEKNTLLAHGQQEKKILESRQTQQQTQVNQLKKQQKTVEALILEQQKQEAELNARINRLIEEEIAREKARLEAEERKRAAAEEARRRAEAKSKNNKNTTTTTDVSSKSAASKETFNIPTADKKLSGNFEANKGRLPLPITGSYRLVRGYGYYSPEGLSHVKLQSNGWYLKGQDNAKAKCIFDGEVSGVYYQGNSYIVTVRHGRYISAYINLASVSVRKGQKVKTHDVLGSLGPDKTLQFQLRNWNTLLNPAAWLRR